MEISSFCNSVFNSVSYRVDGTLIDPGDEWEGFRNVTAVLLTHAHFDHIYGLNRVIELNPDVRIYTNESGREMLLNARKNLSFYHESPFSISKDNNIITVSDGEGFEVEEGLIVNPVFAPGHNPSCITWLINDAVFTGDSLIPGVKTVTNLPYGDKKKADESIEKITEIAEGKTIYPGHSINV